MTKIGINGFGRIGRMAFRAAMERDDVQVVAVNDLLELRHLAYLLKHDSVHGRFRHDVAVRDNFLLVDGRPVRTTAVKDPAASAWGDAGVEVVIQSTGVFLTKVGGGFSLDPDEIRALAAVSVGPSAGGGCPVVGADGSMNVHFGPAPFFVSM